MLAVAVGGLRRAIDDATWPIEYGPFGSFGPLRPFGPFGFVEHCSERVNVNFNPVFRAEGKTPIHPFPDPRLDQQIS